MAYVYYTVTAVLLYLFSDWILNLIEKRVGKRLEYRSAIFFVIIAVLAVGSFEMIDRVIGEPPQTTSLPGETPPSNQGTPNTNLETDTYKN
jgi:hypothetical protein